MLVCSKPILIPNLLHTTWSIRDLMLSESILNIITLPFALRFLQTQSVDQYGCRVAGYSPERIHFVWSCFRFAIFSGICSVCSIGFFFLLIFMKKRNGARPQRVNEYELRRATGFHMIFTMLIMIGTFVSNWVFWASESHPDRSSI